VLAVHEHWHVFRTGRDNLVSRCERVGASHRVVTANSGREALERIASEHYDVILTDIRMPDLDGRALYEEIKRRWPELAERVVFVTGDTLGSTLRDLASEIGRPVIEKPLLPGDVRSVVAAMPVAGRNPAERPGD
jgi:CheY-like chemotaxis protein